jgi:hypothetical protein
MLIAFHLARQTLANYTSKFSRHDFTLPQLLACLVAKEQLKCSYRQAEALLVDSAHWCRAIGMSKAPDHNTLCRAAALLLGKCKVRRLLDAMVRWAALTQALGLSAKPLALDSSCYEVRHVSRYFEFRRGRGGGSHGRRRKLKALPRLGLGVACASHLILSARTGTGGGADYALFEPLLFDAWRRVPNRHFSVVADKGFDSEPNHQIAREDLGVRSIIPPRAAWKTGNTPLGHWRGQMSRLLRTGFNRKRCGYTQRWQVETVNSMIKRNLGAALRGRTSQSRERDLWLKVLTHDFMMLRRQVRVETEHDCPQFLVMALIRPTRHRLEEKLESRLPFGRGLLSSRLPIYLLS